MDNSGRLYSQVAAEAKVSVEDAMVAVYLSNLSRQGKSLNDAAELMRKERCDVRDVARDWGISFSDYSTSTPLELIWKKAKPGRWELWHGDEVIAEAKRQTDPFGRASYRAELLVSDARTWDEASTYELAMKRLSLIIDRRSVGMFGVDDIAIHIDDGNSRWQIAPKVAEQPQRLQSALAA